MSDTDNLILETKKNGDLSNVLWDMLSAPNYKIAIILIIIIMLISSTVFIENILNKFSQAVDGGGKYPTSYGIMLQSMFIAMAYIIIDLMSRQEII